MAVLTETSTGLTITETTTGEPIGEVGTDYSNGTTTTPLTVVAKSTVEADGGLAVPPDWRYGRRR